MVVGIFDIVGTVASGWLTDRIDPRTFAAGPLHLPRGGSGAAALAPRRLRSPVETRYEYVLTDAGADTFPVITALAQWGERQRPHPDPGVRMDVVHRACGQQTSTADVCSHCGAPLTAESTSWRKTWRTPDELELVGASDLIPSGDQAGQPV